jgi:hypothetical protein
VSEQDPLAAVFSAFFVRAREAIERDEALRVAVRDFFETLQRPAAERANRTSTAADSADAQTRGQNAQATSSLANGKHGHTEHAGSHQSSEHLAAETKVYTPPVITGPRISRRLQIGDSNPVETVTQGHAVLDIRAASEGETGFTPPPKWSTPPAKAAEPPELPDLELASRSAALKAEACQLIASDATDPTRLAQIEIELQSLRRSPRESGDIWMFNAERNADRLKDTAAMLAAAECYRALKLAAQLGALLAKYDQLHPDTGLERPFQLMAQAQSGVRRLVNESAGEQDSDQFAVFRWLRTLTAEDQCRVMIDRYMRRDDVAEIADAPALASLLQAEVDERGTRLDAERRTRKTMQKLTHKARQIADGKAEDPLETWKQIDALVQEAIDAGLRPTDAKLRAAIAPAAERIIEEFDAGDALKRLLEEELRVSAMRRVAAEETNGPRLETARQASELLRTLGIQRIAVAGGLDYPEQRQRLKRDLGVDEVVRITAPEEKSNADLGSRVKASQPDLVFVTRWLSHPETDHVLKACQLLGLRAIRLPYNSGLGTGAVAEAILQQLKPEQTN